MNEHEKRAWVYGAVKALADAGVVYRDGPGIKVAQFGGIDPYAMYGYGGGGYGGGGYGEEEEETPLDALEQNPAALGAMGGGLGAVGGGLLGAGLGGLGGYYGGKALNELFDTDVDPQTLATILSLVGGLTGAGAGGGLGAQQAVGLSQPQQQVPPQMMMGGGQ